MADLLIDDIPDALTLTLQHVKKGRAAFSAQDLQEYPGMEQVLREGRAKIRKGTGKNVQIPLVLQHGTGSARHVGVNSRDQLQQVDLATTLTVPWRHTETSYMYYEQIMLENSGDEEQLYDYVDLQRYDGMLQLYNLCEADVWGFRPATDTLAPFGIQNWIDYDATTGFTGGNGTGYSSLCGVDYSTDANKRGRNYSAQYTNMDAPDWLTKVRNMRDRIGFKSPLSIKDYYSGVGDKSQIYTNLNGKRSVETLMESRNENLGFEVGPDRRPTFDGNPINRVPAFDGEYDFAATAAANSDPFYFINWGCMGTVFLKGNYLKETGPTRLTGYEHKTFGVWVDLTWNMFCTHRNRQGVVAKSDPAA